MSKCMFTSPEFQEAVKKVIKDDPELIKEIVLETIKEELLVKENADYSF